MLPIIGKILEVIAVKAASGLIGRFFKKKEVINMGKAVGGNLRTSLTAFITGIAGLASHFGFILPQEWFPVIITIGVAVIGMLGKDGDK